MFLVCLSPLVAAQATPAALWIGTWATSPVQVDSHRSFNRQTLRQIVHVSIRGDRIRVVLSNAFGSVPLTVGAAHVALRVKDAAIDPE